MKCKHIVGWMYDYDNSCTLTFDGLKRELENIKRSNKYKKETGLGAFIVKEFSLQDYFNSKKLNNIEIFNYCPKCGKKLILEELESDK